jgi:hypothetical protein
MADKKVKIIKKVGTGKPATMHNSHLDLSIKNENDTVVFESTEGIDVKIWFPNPILEYVSPSSGQGGPVKIIELPSGTLNSEKLKVLDDIPPNEEYFYTIWIEQDNDFMEVGSHPSIITDP